MQEAAPYKTVGIWSLASQLTNHPSKTNKTCWTLLKKQGKTHDILLWTPTHGPTSVGFVQTLDAV